MAKFKLGRIKVDSWTQLNKLKYNEDKFDLECIPRSVLFSRLYSINEIKQRFDVSAKCSMISGGIFFFVMWFLKI